MQSKQLINQFSQRYTVPPKQKTKITSKSNIKIISHNLPLNFFQPSKLQSESSLKQQQQIQIVTPSFGYKDCQKQKNGKTHERIKDRWFVKKKNVLTSRAQTEPLQYNQVFSRDIYTKLERRSNQVGKRYPFFNQEKSNEKKNLLTNYNIQKYNEKIKKQKSNSQLQKKLNYKYSWEKIKPQKEQRFLGNFVIQKAHLDKQLLKKVNKSINSYRPKKILPPITIQN